MSTMMIQLENVRDWRGQNVFDVDGEKIGKLEDVYFDAETDEPRFACVRVGLLGRQVSLVPLEGSSVSREYIQVRRSKEEVRNGPTMQPGGEMTEEEEERLYRYYGLDYAPASTPSRRRLVRR